MNEETVNIISAWQLRLAELSQALAAAQQAQREAEVERDEWQHAIERSQAAADAQFKRAEAAETALARAREALERVKWQEDLDETCCPTGSYHCIGCYAWRGKKGQPEVHDPKCFVAAALEATQLSPTQRETDTETAPD